MPSHSNLEAIEKEARKLLHALRRKDASALRRHHSVDSLAGMLEPRLAEAQYVIAREHGFSSWLKLKEQFGERMNGEL